MQCAICNRRLLLADIPYKICSMCITTAVVNGNIQEAIREHISKAWVEFYAKKEGGVL